MRAVVANDLYPPPASGLATSRRSDFSFAWLMLAAAFAFIWLSRAHGPVFLQQWFVSIPFETPLDFLLLFVAAFCAISLHELGHLVAALSLDFQVQGGSLGPLRIQTLHGKWKFFFIPRQFFAGSISAVPHSLDGWRAAMLTVIAAGPLATLASGVAAANWHVAGQHERLFQIIFLQISILLFMLGLIPNGTNARVKNDMRLFIDLAFRRPGVEEMELYVTLSQQILKGVRPRDYPPALLTRLARWDGRLESQHMFAQALVRWALDSDETQLADAWDLRALVVAEQCASRVQDIALASSACLDVLFREDFDSARSKFSRVNWNTLFPEWFERRARACQQVALGRLHRAPAEIIRAQYALPVGVAAYALERALLDRLHMKVLIAAAIKARGQFREASA